MRGAEWYDTLAELRDVLNDAVDVHTMEQDAPVCSVYPGRMAPVCAELEALAIRELDKELVHRKEIVALGFNKPTGVEWRTLTNIATKEPWTEFTVSGAQVLEVLQEVHEIWGGRLENPRQHVVLWHSHYDVQGPSAFDVEFFPTWLTEWAMVYHAPSRTTIPYEATSGEFMSTKALDNDSVRATDG